MKSLVELERDRAHRLLINLIMAGGWRPNVSLSERKLSDAIQMGRMPIREALQQLEREGLIEILPARGTFVREVTPQELREVYAVREVLECLATRLAAEKGLTPELRMRAVQMRDIAAAPQTYTAVEIDEAGTALHDAIYTSASNRALTAAFRPLRARARLAFGLPRFFGIHEAAGLAEHLKILDAIETKDGELASRLMMEHLRRGLALRIHLLASRLHPANQSGDALIEPCAAAN